MTLGDGSVLPADTVVIGIGAIPNTEWVASSGVALDVGILIDQHYGTPVDRVYAVGDCARVFDPVTSLHLRQEPGRERSTLRVAPARHILGRPAAKTVAPYFWSDQYGGLLQVCGAVPIGGRPTYVEGPPDAESFVAVFGAADDSTAGSR